MQSVAARTVAARDVRSRPRWPRRSTRSAGSSAPTAATSSSWLPIRRRCASRSRSSSAASPCAECVLPPDQLRDTIEAAIGRRVPRRVRARGRRPPPLTVPEPSAPELWRALVDVYQPVLREVVTELERDAGIDSGTYSVLGYLDRAGGSMPLAELQASCGSATASPGSVGWSSAWRPTGSSTRDVHPDDRRATTVALTRAGRARTRCGTRRLRAGARAPSRRSRRRRRRADDSSTLLERLAAARADR